MCKVIYTFSDQQNGKFEIYYYDTLFISIYIYAGIVEFVKNKKMMVLKFKHSFKMTKDDTIKIIK